MKRMPEALKLFLAFLKQGKKQERTQKSTRQPLWLPGRNFSEVAALPQ